MQGYIIMPISNNSKFPHIPHRNLFCLYTTDIQMLERRWESPCSFNLNLGISVRLKTSELSSEQMVINSSYYLMATFHMRISHTSFSSAKGGLGGWVGGCEMSPDCDLSTSSWVSQGCFEVTLQWWGDNMPICCFLHRDKMRWAITGEIIWDNQNTAIPLPVSDPPGRQAFFAPWP